MKEQTGRQKLERGQSFIELALSLVFFLFLVLGMLDLARVFYIYVALEDSADVAAVYLAQHPNCLTASSGSTCTGTNNATYRAQHASSASINWASVRIYPSQIPAGESEAMVKVKMEYDFKLITPVISKIVGSNQITLSAEAVHVRLG